LTDRVTEAIRRSIVESFTTGDRLPAIGALSASYGVSPPVVREALARLKSEGLVRIRHGAGAFVADAMQRSFRIESVQGGAEQERISAVLRALELRLGVETEAAALAAQRASAADLHRMTAALEAMRRRIAKGLDATAEDLRFHQAIAQAAHNQLFTDFIAFLQQHLRDGIAISHDGSRRRGMMEVVVDEHARILAAIAAGKVDMARDATREHLTNGIARLALAARTVLSTKR
jgi:DNA-binding FadR family transcriptional regulator